VLILILQNIFIPIYVLISLKYRYFQCIQEFCLLFFCKCMSERLSTCWVEYRVWMLPRPLPRPHTHELLAKTIYVAEKVSFFPHVPRSNLYTMRLWLQVEMWIGGSEAPDILGPLNTLNPLLPMANRVEMGCLSVYAKSSRAFKFDINWIKSVVCLLERNSHTDRTHVQ